MDFTARVVADRLGQPVPVFPLSALAARRRSDGFPTFANWLAGELASHGSAHALASTTRALRRKANVLRDALRVQEELLRRRGEHGAATFAALSEILDRAGDHARAAVDHVHGEARRLRGRLDEAHEKAVAGALAASAQILAELSERHRDGSPEDLAASVRAATRPDARRQMLRELDGWRQTAVPRPFGRARSTLQDSLREADRAAERSIEAPAPSTSPRCSRAWLRCETNAVGRRALLSRRWRTWRSASPPWTRWSHCWVAAS